MPAIFAPDLPSRLITKVFGFRHGTYNSFNDLRPMFWPQSYTWQRSFCHILSLPLTICVGVGLGWDHIPELGTPDPNHSCRRLLLESPREYRR